MSGQVESRKVGVMQMKFSSEARAQKSQFFSMSFKWEKFQFLSSVCAT